MSSGSIKNVAVIGGSGKIGRFIVEALLQSTHNYNVTVLSQEQSAYSAPKGARTVKVDYNNHSALVSVLKGQDAVVSAVGSAATRDQIKIADAAIEAGVKRFIPAEYGTDKNYPGNPPERAPSFKAKQDVKDYLDGKIEWTGILTGPIFDLAFEEGFLGFDVHTRTARLDPNNRSSHFSASSRSLVGRAVAQVLAPGIAPRTANKFVHVRSLTVSQDELLTALEKITGEQWKVETVDYSSLVKDARKRLAQGEYMAAIVLIQEAFLDPNAGNNWDERGVVSNKELDLPDEEGLEETLRIILGA
ncbi:hypothetical protein N7499_010298 [Penicillium canescens]|uniref:NmrA-like domain-containing protein n=1 Tax=Penicillium canescens TaxID=5083 RepID=A0AAD6IJ14_PENCN|nr:uncharacterized protein N7446_005450 [Penicillium canescens]KAJ5989765.1 hypothetical protein N7522_009972 [Penicillium canescens]KAJ6050311.1 hypothetical protein N7444_007027 [Penicillium canescens]KAJ6050825.1 hypothetical protein N7460_001359 [Penicillium canescens]KAJ6061330.1 hypothetical protein N7446_005450 [Penicillium canescens]KAJ6068411.1 hypothetical protein N7499_010298 [Penicillium canescens]